MTTNSPLLSLVLTGSVLACTSKPSTTVSQGSPSLASPAQSAVPLARTECPLAEIPLGVIDVDFDGGLSNISGSLAVVVCADGHDTLSPSDIQRIRAEFESIVHELWLPIAFSCSANPPIPAASRKRLVTLHNNALQRINSVLHGPSIQDFVCHLGFSESLP